MRRLVAAGLSFIVVAALGAVISRSVGGQSVPWIWPARSLPSVRIQYAPDPDMVVNLAQVYGTSSAYVVPKGQDLVLTDWVGYAGSFALYINGSLTWQTTGMHHEFYGSWDPGVVAHAGDSVAIASTASAFPYVVTAFASGYLVDQRTFPMTLRVPFTPASADVVRIDMASGPYTVPAGETLVMRGWASADTNNGGSGGGVRIAINGVTSWETPTNDDAFGSIRSGVVARAGDIVSLTTVMGGTDAYVVGFLRTP